MKLCKKIQPQLILYAEKELRGNDLIKVENHIKICSECQQELKALTAFSTNLKPAEYIIPATYSSELIVNIHKKLDKEKSTIKKFIPSISLVSAAILIVLSLVYINDSNMTSEDFLLYNSISSNDLLTEIENFDIEEDITKSLMPDNYISDSQKYILENTTLKSDDYNEVFASMDDTDFDAFLENAKSIKL